MTDKLPVCPHCGSHHVKKIEDFYRCDDCRRDFGRSETADDGTPLTDAVKGLRFRYGDIVSGSVRLRIVEADGKVKYEVYDANEGGVDKVEDELSSEEWMKIKDKLINHLFVSDWDREYIAVNDGQSVPDNNEWELDLDINEDEVLTYRGYDAVPAYWTQLMRIVNPFFKKLEKE